MASVEQQNTKRGATRRAIPGSSEAEERLLAMVTAVTGQLAVTRERVDTLERLIARAGLIDLADIEDYAASEDESRARDAIRRGIISRVFRPLQEAAERDLQRVQSTAVEAVNVED